jgi:predicted MPP superfamily phosphohydrolase
MVAAPAAIELQTEKDAAVYAVLGDHDTISMVPDLEKIGIQVLLNETVTLERGDAHMHLAGIDEVRCFHADDIGTLFAGIPRDEFSILLSHTPEVYRQAAEAGFKLLLAGHTHGGQIVTSRLSLVCHGSTGAPINENGTGTSDHRSPSARQLSAI